MRIILIRHAEPIYEIDSLTKKGFREAQYLGYRAKSWEVENIYVSPLGRAQDTAVPMERSIGKKGITLDWLREFVVPIDDKYGVEGIPWDFKPSFWTKMETLYNKDEWYKNPPMEKSGDNPSVEEMYLSTCTHLDELLKQYGYCREGNLYKVEEHSEATIVMVCHMGISFIMLSHLLGIPFVPLIQGIVLPPSSVTILNTEEVEEGIASFRCQCMGDVKHLHDYKEPISEMGSFAKFFQQ